MGALELKIQVTRDLNYTPSPAPLGVLAGTARAATRTGDSQLRCSSMGLAMLARSRAFLSARGSNDGARARNADGGRRRRAGPGAADGARHAARRRVIAALTHSLSITRAARRPRDPSRREGPRRGAGGTHRVRSASRRRALAGRRGRARPSRPLPSRCRAPSDRTRRGPGRTG